MKTVAFHSYKGGTGRSMAIGNIAMALANSGFKVVMIDLDLDAPGLSFKFDTQDQLTGGIIDYFYEQTAEDRSGDKTKTWRQGLIKRYSTEIELDGLDVSRSGNRGKLHLIPVGNFFSREYYDMLDSNRLRSTFEFKKSNSANIEAFKGDLDTIKGAFDNPDYLLVDCRAAHNVASAALLGWADEVFEFFPVNKEGVFGCFLLKNLLKANQDEIPIKPLHLVACRVPVEFTTESIQKEIVDIAVKFEDNFDLDAVDLFREIYVIREQRNFEIGDKFALLDSKKSEHNLSYEYAELINVITRDKSPEDDWEKNLSLNQKERRIEKTFEFHREKGILRNYDKKLNVALRRETLMKMVQSIATEQVGAIQEIIDGGKSGFFSALKKLLFNMVTNTGNQSSKIVEIAFYKAGLNAGISFGQEAREPGTVWKKGQHPKTPIGRLENWCDFDRESGFGDWSVTYDEEMQSGTMILQDHFLELDETADISSELDKQAYTRIADQFVFGYVHGVLEYLVDYQPNSLKKTPIKSEIASRIDHILTINFSKIENESASTDE